MCLVWVFQSTGDQTGDKRVDLLFLLGQEIRGRFVQHKQSGCTIECHFRSDWDRWRGNIVSAEHGKDRDEVLGTRGIAAEEGSLGRSTRDEIKRPTRW